MIQKNTRLFIERVVTVFLSFCAVVATIYGLLAFIDWRVSETVNTDDFLQRLSASVRPSCIFDEKGSIIYDQGAMEFIDDIKIIERYNAIPTKILIRPKRLLSVAPLITPLEEYVAVSTAERGEKYDWIITLDLTSSAGSDSFKTAKYRLEVLY